MPAHIETFASTQVEWHREGTKLDGPVDSATMREKAGLNWTVSKRPLFIADAQGNAQEVKGYKALARDTDDRIYNVVTDRYVPIQYADMFNMTDALTQEHADLGGGMQYETAGALQGGAKGFCLGKLKKAFEVEAGDEHRTYLFCTTSHDGSSALRVFWTDVRVVCANTLAVALRGAGDKGIRILHNADAKHNMEDAKRILQLAQEQTSEMEELFQHFRAIVMQEQTAQRFLDTLIPPPRALPAGTVSPDVVEAYEKQVATVTRVHDRLKELHEGGRGTTQFPGIKGTAYGWLNAVTEYGTHEMRRKDATTGAMLNAIATGSAASMNRRAIGILKGDDLADDAPVGDLVDA